MGEDRVHSPQSVAGDTIHFLGSHVSVSIQKTFFFFNFAQTTLQMEITEFKPMHFKTHVGRAPEMQLSGDLVSGSKHHRPLRG